MLAGCSTFCCTALARAGSSPNHEDGGLDFRASYGAENRLESSGNSYKNPDDATMGRLNADLRNGLEGALGSKRTRFASAFVWFRPLPETRASARTLEQTAQEIASASSGA
eukprot:2776156-Amphidinium_carterae.1